MSFIRPSKERRGWSFLFANSVGCIIGLSSFVFDIPKMLLLLKANLHHMQEGTLLLSEFSPWWRDGDSSNYTPDDDFLLVSVFLPHSFSQLFLSKLLLLVLSELVELFGIVASTLCEHFKRTFFDKYAFASSYSVPFFSNFFILYVLNQLFFSCLPFSYSIDTFELNSLLSID
jgi:hypothetical protein